ncbi:LysR family transcriptional regulator [Pelagibaculum spongiae]|uniref:LysR family transcriptional regulator n=1 Tax=Pelagibaculum spongiae TaxID=2080658 RepID=A0A2V1GWC8_9GAMM|nr:LysR family transcriptional regulator [Pelagibaculum spongiae]PVZ63419.1 LysR family transcriptional regulator [Pelagibaculum spongiae]
MASQQIKPSAKVTLEQWQALIAVVEQGGYAAAAEYLRKSQSSISYSVQKLESNLGLRLFKLQGRKSVLTERGKLIYHSACQLLQQSQQIESLAQQFSKGVESDIKIAYDALFPTWMILDAVANFQKSYPLTRVELRETVLSGTTEAMLDSQYQIAIGAILTPGIIGDPIIDVEFLAVASPEHPLHQLKRTIDEVDLRQHCQLVISDSGKQNRDGGWLGSPKRLTVSHPTASIYAACKGIGFAWLPIEKIRPELVSGQLKTLPLKQGRARKVPLYMVHSHHGYSGPATNHMIDMIRQQIAAHQPLDCSGQTDSP